MASRRKKLDVEEAATEETQGSGMKMEEVCVFVTTASLVLGIIMVLIVWGRDYAGGPFG